MTSFAELNADLESHHIEGYLRGGEQLSVPLISHIRKNLYVGGCVDGVNLGNTFAYVFSVYRWERYVVGADTKHYEFRMYDSSDVDEETVERVSDRVAEALVEGGDVLVHCQAGINRSNLVASRAMTKAWGLLPHQTVAMLRDNRSQLVLSNSEFLKYLVRKGLQH